jgi:hypothetical protein
VEIWPQQNKKHLEAYPYYLGSFGTHIILFFNAIFPRKFSKKKIENEKYFKIYSGIFFLFEMKSSADMCIWKLTQEICTPKGVFQVLGVPLVS